MEFFMFLVIILSIGIFYEIMELKKQTRKIEKKLAYEMKGEIAMSKILEELKGEECIIKLNCAIDNEIKCKIIDVDEEWIKLKVNRKESESIRIVRIDDISEVQKEK